MPLQSLLNTEWSFLKHSTVMSTFWGKPFKVLTMANKSLYNHTQLLIHLGFYDPTPATLASSDMTGNCGHSWMVLAMCFIHLVGYMIRMQWVKWHAYTQFHIQCQMVFQCGFPNLYFSYPFILHSMRMEWNGMLMEYVENSYHSTYLKTSNC